MLKAIKILILTLLIFHLLHLSSIASSEPKEVDYRHEIDYEISLPITQDSYAKEQIWYGDPFASRYLLLGYDSVYKHMRTRPHLSYDSANLAGLESKDIYKAYLALWNWRPLNFNPYDVKIYPITKPWSERDLRWNTQPEVGPEANVERMISQEGWQYFDITNIVKLDLSGELKNYGITLQKDLEYEFGAYFCSTNITTAAIFNDGCSEESLPQILVQINTTQVPPTLTFDGIETLSWSKHNESETYEVAFSRDAYTTTATISYANDSFAVVGKLEPGINYFRVRSSYRDAKSDWSNTIEIEIPVSEEIVDPELDNLVEQETLIEDNKVDNEINETDSILPELNTSPKKEEQDVLGIRSDVLVEPGTLAPSKVEAKDNYYDCKITYNQTTKISKSPWCKYNIPKIVSTKFSLGEGNTSINATYKHPEHLNIIFETYKCKRKTVKDIRTLFSCVPELVSSKGYFQDVTYIATLKINGKRYNSKLRYSKYDTYTASFTADKIGRNVTGEILYQAYYSFTPGSGIKINNEKVINGKHKITSPHEIQNIPNSKPFELMLVLPTSVTQWHGNTDYQSPHPGIDFGVSKKPLYAIGDGVIEAKLWDDYYGECNSGGNVLRIKHSNGMHSVYMHLTEDYDGQQTTLKVGDTVTKGQLVGLSGNSGAYNCQPLASHLHFELRKSKSQSTHIDPVSYIGTDWDGIVTKDAIKYPGRLTGDNPHPGR